MTAPSQNTAVPFAAVKAAARTLRSLVDRRTSTGDVRRILDQTLGAGAAGPIRRHPDAVTFTVRVAELGEQVTVTVTEKGGWVTVRF